MLWLMPVSGFDRYDDHLVGQPAGWPAGSCICEIKKLFRVKISQGAWAVQCHSISNE
jgi:hypothetical protein